MDLVPYKGGGDLPATLPSAQLVPLGPGEFAALHISIKASAMEQFITTIEQWFEDREEVIFVDSGVSSKQGTGYVVLEWEECQIDQLFIRILDTTATIVDYALYIRSEEAYS